MPDKKKKDYEGQYAQLMKKRDELFDPKREMQFQPDVLPTKRHYEQGPQYSPEEQATLDWLRNQKHQAIQGGVQQAPLMRYDDLGLGEMPSYELQYDPYLPPTSEPRPRIPGGLSREEFMRDYQVDEERRRLMPKSYYQHQQGKDLANRDMLAELQLIARRLGSK